MTVEQQLKELKKSIKRNIKEEFKFQPELWRKYKKSRNCLTYAFNMRIGNIDRNIIACYEILVGKSEMDVDEASVEEWYEITVKMLEKLCLKFRKCSFETEVPKGYFKVAWCITTQDIHWLRRDDNGTWSHKQGWYEMPTNIDLDGNIILNPETANILEKDDSIVEIRYFLVSRNYQG